MAESKEHYSAETMIALLDKWEAEHISKIKREQANIEVGQVQDALRHIGVRLSQRIQAETRNRCNACDKPLITTQGPYNTIPIYDIQKQDYRNQYACSAKCSEKLQQKARDAQLYLQTH